MKATFENWDVQQFEHPIIGGKVLETACSINLLENMKEGSPCNIYIECWPKFIGDSDAVVVELSDDEKELKDGISGFKCIRRAMVRVDENKYCYQAILRREPGGKNPYTEINFFLKEDLFRVGNLYTINLK